MHIGSLGVKVVLHRPRCYILNPMATRKVPALPRMLVKIHSRNRSAAFPVSILSLSLPGFQWPASLPSSERNRSAGQPSTHAIKPSAPISDPSSLAAIRPMVAALIGLSSGLVLALILMRILRSVLVGLHTGH